MEFNCEKCGSKIVIRFLKPGEKCQCKNCGFRQTVPAGERIKEAQTNDKNEVQEAIPPISPSRFIVAVLIGIPVIYVGFEGDVGPLLMFIPMFAGFVGGRIVRRPWLGTIAGFLGVFAGSIFLWNSLTLGGFCLILTFGIIGGFSGHAGGEYGLRQWRRYRNSG